MQKQTTDSRKLDELAAAISERREFLGKLYARTGNTYIASRLVPVARLAHCLATRYLGSPTRQSPFTPTHELAWYEGYLVALCETGKEIQEAVRSQQLTLRSPRTRARMPATETDAWISRDLRAEVTSAKPFDVTGCRAAATGTGRPDAFVLPLDRSPRESAVGPEWPDAHVVPAGWGFDQRETEVWLEMTGILRGAEFRSLSAILSVAEAPATRQLQTSTGADVGKPAVRDRTGSKPEWHLPLLIEADSYVLETQPKNGFPTKRAVAEHLHVYAKEQEIRTSGQGRTPSAGSIERHVLRGWVAPTPSTT